MTGSRYCVLILSLILIIGLSVPAGAQLLPLAPLLPLPPPALQQSVPIIVQILPTASITAIANLFGGTVVDSIPGANTYLLNVPLNLPLQNLPLNLPLVLPQLNLSFLGIQFAEINLGVSAPGFAVLSLVTVPGTVAPDWYKEQPAWQRIEAEKALQYSTGSGVVIADINSLVDYAHPALTGHLTGGYDFVASKPSGTTSLNQSEAGFLDQSEAGFLDQSEAGFLNQSEAGFLDGLGLAKNPAYSHGTLCAGIIAAIAPGSLIMPLRAFDNNGQSDLFTLAKAIRYGVQNGAQVINMSFGTYYPSKALQSAIQYAQQNNVLLAASAGNDNSSKPQYPAGFSGVMTTAATDLMDKKATFSNYGSDVFVDAPGVNIISAYPGGYYSIVSGTSFSAPAVAGTAALVRSLSTIGGADAIAGGAVDISYINPSYVNQLGHGRIDVFKAVKPN